MLRMADIPKNQVILAAGLPSLMTQDACKISFILYVYESLLADDNSSSGVFGGPKKTRNAKS